MLVDYIILAVIAVLIMGGGLILYLKTKHYRLLDIAKLEWMIDQFNQSAERTCAAIDNTLEFVDASNKRIAAMEHRANSRRANK
jgi:hypothetical protein